MKLTIINSLIYHWFLHKPGQAQPTGTPYHTGSGGFETTKHEIVPLNKTLSGIIHI